ncbi:hypothetical protein HDU88_009007 [Geranomyces variabilis]|nr:hypothetical protein HDU88_009007 [Geranomyces variabilis]
MQTLLPAQKLLLNASESEWRDPELGRLKDLARQAPCAKRDRRGRAGQADGDEEQTGEGSEGQMEVASDGNSVAAIGTVTRLEVSRTSPFEACVKVLGRVC